MKFGSVCSGIEAASVAWNPLGWVAAWFAEIEKFPSAVLKHRHPETPNLGDMTKLHEHEVFNGSAIDVLVGGTPCQSFSVAGLRKGFADARGNLAITFCAIAHAKRPRWVIWENVPGVLSDKGNAFGCFLAGLAGASSELVAPLEGWAGAGVVSGPVYGLAWRVLDAQHFGVPQRRRRVFVVGHLGDWRRAAQVLLEPESVPGDSAAGGEAGQVATEDAGRCFTPGQHAAYKEGVGTIRANGGDLGGGSENLIAHTLRGEGFDAREDGTGRGVPLVAVERERENSGEDADGKIGDENERERRDIDCGAFPWQSALDPIGVPRDICPTLIKNQTMAVYQKKKEL